MCTAISLFNENHYFGRTLDINCAYNEEVVITPKNFSLKFRCLPKIDKHFAIIGMATVFDDNPLYYEGVNEKGLCIAGLNFPGNADYKAILKEKENVAPFELIPYLLGICETVKDAKEKLERINIINIKFKDSLPLAPLHWIVSDKTESITVECVKEGLKVYENRVGVLTNNPPFPYHLTNLNNYISLSENSPQNNLSENVDFSQISLGMGAWGLPGDFSSISRFIRTVFIKSKAIFDGNEKSKVSTFFRILSSISMIKGAVKADDGTFEYTKYMCCVNATKGIYYYSNYENFGFGEVSLNSENLDSANLLRFSLKY